jgi:hypothetical protein
MNREEQVVEARKEVAKLAASVRTAAGYSPDPIKKYVTIELTNTDVSLFFHLLYQPKIELDVWYVDVKDRMMDTESDMKKVFAKIDESWRSTKFRFDPYVEKAKEGNYLHVGGISWQAQYPKGWLEKLGVRSAKDFKKMILPLIGTTWEVREVSIV